MIFASELASRRRTTATRSYAPSSRRRALGTMSLSLMKRLRLTINLIPLRKCRSRFLGARKPTPKYKSSEPKVMSTFHIPAIEAQAVGRVYRLGQKRPVEITRLVMENSVEERMMKMLEKKYGANKLDGSGGAAAAPAADALPSANNIPATASPLEASDDDDTTPAATETQPCIVLVGNIKSDKAEIMADEFDLLFGVEGTFAAVAPTVTVFPRRTPPLVAISHCVN